MNKENKDNLTDLVEMVSQSDKPTEGSQQKPETVTGRDGKPVILGVDELQTASLSNTKSRKKRASEGFLALFGKKYRDDGSDIVE